MLSRKPTISEIKSGLSLKYYGDFDVEYFHIVEINYGWAIFSDGESADINYICSNESGYFIDEELV